MMKAKELRAMSVADLEAKAADLKKDLFFLRMHTRPTSSITPSKSLLSRKTLPASRLLFVRKRPQSEEVSNYE